MTRRFRSRAGGALLAVALGLGAFAGPASSTPEGQTPGVTIDISPNDGDNLANGQAVNVTGAGFNAAETVTIEQCTQDLAKCGQTPLGTAQTNGSGSFGPKTVTPSVTFTPLNEAPVDCRAVPCVILASGNGGKSAYHHISFAPAAPNEGDVVAPPAGPFGPLTPVDDTKPALGPLALSPKSFRAARSGPTIAKLTGSRVSYVLSEAAAVSFRVERARPGRRSGRRCVRPRRSNRSRRRCTRFVLLRGSFTHGGKAATNSFRFRGRLRGRRLRPGRYRLRGVATDAAKNASPVRRTAFRIIR
jgi:hypothetical protein